MKGFGRLKSDYVNQSRQRIQELDSEIDRIGKRVSIIYPVESLGECTSLLGELKEEVNELASNVSDLNALRSDAWDWTLEIEDTERLFERLSRRVREAQEFLEENLEENEGNNALRKSAN